MPDLVLYLFGSASSLMSFSNRFICLVESKPAKHPYSDTSCLYEVNEFSVLFKKTALFFFDFKDTGGSKNNSNF